METSTKIKLAALKALTFILNHLVGMLFILGLIVIGYSQHFNIASYLLITLKGLALCVVISLLNSYLERAAGHCKDIYFRIWYKEQLANEEWNKALCDGAESQLKTAIFGQNFKL